MEKLDLKDRKIIYHLDFDSRQSFRTIGKKVGLSKDVVTNRVKRLQEKGIIKNFYTYIDTSKFHGMISFRCYFSFQNATPDIKKEIVDYLVKSDYTNSVHSIFGSYDLIFFIYAKTLPEVYIFWDKILEKYGDYFSKKEFHVLYQESCYDYLFLLEEKDRKIKNRNYLHQWNDDQKIVQTNDLDHKICKLISINSRMKTIDIAKELNLNVVTIKNRIKNLKESGIILGYRISINWPKLGYYYYKLDIELKQYHNRNQIIHYLIENPSLKYYFRSIGYVDLEFVFMLNNAHQLNQIIEDLSSKFPDTIKDYSYFNTVETYKLDTY